MKDKDKILDEIFSNDPLGLLNVKPKTSNVKSADERLSASFEEINEFIAKHDREPSPNTTNPTEFQLYSRLKNFREDENKMLALEPQDIYGLLQFEKKEINSIDDIFNDDMLGLFDDGEAQSLFEFKHTPREIARAEADFVARRKPCKNFKDYEELFKSVQADLASGKRKLVKFHENQLNQGSYFVHGGIVLFLEKVIDVEVDKFGKADGRTRIVFENGTESSMKLRSLGKNLFLNGQGITLSSESEVEEFMENFLDITDEDKEAGYIYVLSSKSTDPQISEIRNLYKIGYSTAPVANRIKNAEKESTYLMAPVHVEAEYKTFNMNTQKFEQLLHNFFGASCLNIDIWDEKLRRRMPQEWFVVPLSIIDRAVEMIGTEEIKYYKYDRELEAIVLRENY
jgi:hypothetical protein